MGKNKQHNKHHSSSSSSSDSSNKHRSHSSSLSDNCDELYKYLKHRLIKDRSMMPYGSDAHSSYYSTRAQMVVLGAPVLFDYNQDSLNIDHAVGSGDLYVRKDGLYVLVFSANTQQAVQMAVFVNDVLIPSSVVGKNSGAAQLIIREFLYLNKDDHITVRNFNSAIGTIDIDPNIGGTIAGTNTEIVLNKIAPLPKYICDRERNNNRKNKNRHLFKEILEKMLCDKSLDLYYSEAYGAFWRVSPQTLAVGDAVIFEAHRNLKCMENVVGTSDVIAKLSGSYMFEFIMEANKSCQMTLFVNGIPDLTTTVGIDKAAGTVYLRQVLQIQAGDVITIRNHISSAGTIDLTATVGGLQTGNQAILIVKRIGPLISNLVCEEIYKYKLKCNDECDEDSEYEKDEHRNCLYEEYREFLLENHCLMPAGSDAYAYLYSTTTQQLVPEQAVIFQNNQVTKNIEHVQGKPEIKVCKSGIYRLAVNIQTDQPAQFTAFVNGVPDIATTFGTDTGAGETTLKQLMALKKGDVITVVNHTSFINPIQTSGNPGGFSVGNNANIGLDRIAPLPKNYKDDYKCKKTGR